MRVETSNGQGSAGPRTARLAELLADREPEIGLAESLLHILRNHARDGDRWMRLQTAALIDRDIRKLEVRS
jgi:hypothetical protein